MRAALLVVLLCGAARADVPSLTPSTIEAFNAHYRDAKELMLGDHYEEAIFEFRAAYAIRPEPRLLLNIGHAYMGLRRPKEALTHYLRYQSKLSAQAERDEVEAYISEARGQLAILEEPRPSGWRPDGTQEPSAQEIGDAERRIQADTQRQLRAVMESVKRERRAEVPIYRRGWFWGVIGGVAGVAVAGVVTGVVLGSRRSTELVGVDTRVVTFPGD